MGTLTSCFNPNNEKGKESQQIKQYDPELALQTNIVKAQDDADIDVYFSSWGVQPFYNLLRLAMLSNKEVHFILMPFHEFQRNINVDALTNFLKNDRVVDQTNEEVIRANSSVIVADQDDEWYDNSIVTTYVTDLVEKNPDNKIALWSNSDHMRNQIHILQLVRNNDNVRYNGIEDSNALSQFIADKWIPDLMDIYYTPRTNTWRDTLSPNRHSQYILPTNNPRIKIYFSSHTDIRKLESYGLRNIYSFFPDGDNEQEEIKDFIFTQRDKNKKRLFSQWTLITNINWEDARNQVNADKAAN